MIRRTFYIVSALFWLGVVLLLLEAGLRVLSSKRMEASFYLPVLGEAKARDDEAIREASLAPGERPAFARADLPSREALSDEPPDGRLAYAEARREVLLLCSRDGAVVERYVPGDCPELEPVIAWVTGLVNLAEGLPEEEARDALDFMRGVLDNGWAGPREYGLPQADGQRYQAAFWFQELKAAGSDGGLVAVHVCPSVYEEIWSRFRPHIYRKNHYLEFNESEFWTNAQGCRDDELVLPKPEGVYRIVCIGGSTTVEGPTNALTYPNFLERRLRAEFKTDRIEVVNCGVDALDSPHELKNLPFYLSLEPDLILHYNFANEAAPVFAKALLETGSTAGDGHSWLGRAVRSRVLAYVFPFVRRLLLPGRDVVSEALKAKVFANHRAIKEAAAAAGVDFAICSYAAPHVAWWNIPMRGYLDRIFDGWCIPDYGVYADLVQAYNRRLRGFCEETGAIYVPVGERFTGGMETFTDNCHLHVHGIERKAELVFEALRGVVAEGLREG